MRSFTGLCYSFHRCFEGVRKVCACGTTNVRGVSCLSIQKGNPFKSCRFQCARRLVTKANKAFLFRLFLIGAFVRISESAAKQCTRWPQKHAGLHKAGNHAPESRLSSRPRGFVQQVQGLGFVGFCLKPTLGSLAVPFCSFHLGSPDKNRILGKKGTLTI